MTHKRPLKPLSPRQLSSEKPEDQLLTLQGRVAHYFGNEAPKQDLNIKEASPYIHKYLESHISHARTSLGIQEHEYLTTSDPEDAYEAELWIIDSIAEKDNHKLNEEGYSRQIIEIIKGICADTGIPISWYEYLIIYIAINKPPMNSDIYKEDLVTVERIEEDALILRINKGTKHSDFQNTWRAVSPFLKQPANNPKLYSVKDLMNRDHKTGMTNSAIAEKYYPEQYASDPTSAVDRAKKIISRLNS